MKNKILSIFFIIVFGFILFGFNYINQNNYTLIKEEKKQYVKHPELLPEKNIVKYTSFGFSNLKADIYWLETIQYIGSNVISAEYKKYLYQMIDLITELNPYFEKPYIIGQLLLPNYNERYETLTQEEINEYSLKGEKIGEKGINNFCNKEKTELIKNENDLNLLWSDEKYKNPCISSDIALQQAFIEFYYLKNHKKSAEYYKIASVNEDSLVGAKIMAGIMSGKSGNREISIMTFLTLAQTKAENDEVCSLFIKNLKNLNGIIFQEGNELTQNIIKQINDLSEEYYPFEENDDTALSGDSCKNYINKTIRQFNLTYLDQANEKFFEKFGNYAQTPEELIENGIITYSPLDFQQYDDYGIVYYYNSETKNFDSKMNH